jgi:hypothetical protein
MGRKRCYRDYEASPCDRVIASLPCGCAAQIAGEEMREEEERPRCRAPEQNI